MASVNKVQLIGNVGKDPEVRYLASGAAVANLSLATTSKRKDKNTGESIEDTQWPRLVFHERLAEIAGEFVRKGSPIFIEGRIKYGKYTDKNGVEKYTTDIVVSELQLLGSRQDRPEGQQAPANRPAAQPQRQDQPATSDSGFDDFDSEEIPF